ncbi:MAG: hypothetical protein AB1589_21015 [Cyanobacteriota bacterium]
MFTSLLKEYASPILVKDSAWLVYLTSVTHEKQVTLSLRRSDSCHSKDIEAIAQRHSKLVRNTL